MDILRIVKIPLTIKIENFSMIQANFSYWVDHLKAHSHLKHYINFH